MDAEKPDINYELAHDSIARQVYEKAGAEARARRKVERFVRERHEAWQEREAKLTQDDLDFVTPYLETINVSQLEAEFIERERRRIKKRKTLTRWGVVLGISILVGLLLWTNDQRIQAQRSEQRAQAVSLSYLSNSLPPSSDSEAFALLLEAWKLSNGEIPMVKQSMSSYYYRLMKAQLELPGSNRGITCSHEHGVMDVDFSASGSLIVSGTKAGEVVLWNRKGVQLAISTVHSEAVSDVEVSPDAQRILSVAADSFACILDTAGVVLSRLPHKVQVLKGQFSMDGQKVITFAGDSIIRVWDVNRTDPIVELPTKFEDVTVAQYSPCQNAIVVGASDGTISAWELSGELIQSSNQHGERLQSISFAPLDCSMLSISLSGKIRLWNSAWKLRQSHFAHGEWYGAFHPLRDNYYSTVNASKPRLTSWASNTSALVQSDSVGYLDKGIYHFEYSPDGQWMVFSYESSAEVFLTDQSGNVSKRFNTDKGRPFSYITPRFLPDSRSILYFTKEASSFTIKPVQSDVPNQWVPVEGDAVSASFSAGGKKIAITARQRLAVFDAEFKQVFTVSESARSFHKATLSPDGEILVGVSSKVWFATSDRSEGVSLSDCPSVLTVWNESGDTLFTIQSETTLTSKYSTGIPIPDYYFSPDSKYIVINLGSEVKIFDRRGREIGRYVAPDGEVSKIRFSSDGANLYLFTAHKSFSIYSISDKRVLKEIVLPDSTRVTHSWLNDYETITLKLENNRLAIERYRLDEHILKKQKSCQIEIGKANSFSYRFKDNYVLFEKFGISRVLEIIDTSCHLLVDINVGYPYRILDFSADYIVALVRPSSDLPYQEVKLFDWNGDLVAEIPPPVNGIEYLDAFFAPDRSHIVTRSNAGEITYWPTPKEVYKRVRADAAIPELTPAQRKLYGID